MNPPFWSLRAYENAWTRSGVAEKPADYARAFRDRYGLHSPPYDNGDLPMGFTRAKGLLGIGQGIGNDCLLMQETAAGQTIIGLGNAALDMQSLYEEMAAADTLDPVMPLPLCNVRDTGRLELCRLPDAVSRQGSEASSPGQVSFVYDALRGYPGLVALQEEENDLPPWPRR